MAYNKTFHGRDIHGELLLWSCEQALSAAQTDRQTDKGTAYI